MALCIINNFKYSPFFSFLQIFSESFEVGILFCLIIPRVIQNIQEQLSNHGKCLLIISIKSQCFIFLIKYFYLLFELLLQLQECFDKKVVLDIHFCLISFKIINQVVRILKISMNQRFFCCLRTVFMNSLLMTLTQS